MSRRDYEIYESKKAIFARDNWRCQFPDCDVRGQENLQVAHRIKQGKGSEDYVMVFWYDQYGQSISRKYAQHIINHPFNMVASCPQHNDAFNIFYKPEERDALLEKIHAESLSDFGIDECCAPRDPWWL